MPLKKGASRKPDQGLATVTGPGLAQLKLNKINVLSDHLVMKFSIGRAAAMSGLTTAQIRNWEARYGFPQPTRDEKGRRVYSQTDIDFLRQCDAWLRLGVRPVDLSVIYKKGLSPAPVQAFAEDNQVASLAAQTNELFENLIKGRIGRADTQLRALLPLIGLSKSLDSIFQPLFSRLGAEWAAGGLDIWQEHIASTFLRTHLFSVMAQLPPPTRDERIFLCTVESEEHVGGLLIIGSQLRLAGYSAKFIGSGFPIPELQKACEKIRPELVCISILQQPESFSTIHRIIATPWPTKIAIGGPAVRRYLTQNRINIELSQTENPKVHLIDSNKVETTVQILQGLINNTAMSAVS